MRDLRAAAARGEQAIAASLSVLYRQLPELEEIARAVTDILAPPAQVGHGTANPVSSDDGGRALDAAILRCGGLDGLKRRHHADGTGTLHLRSQADTAAAQLDGMTPQPVPRPNSAQSSVTD
jgi:hypothetical protein